MLQLGYREQQTGPLLTSSVVWEVQSCVLTPPNLLILSKGLWGLYRCWLSHRVVGPIESPLNWTPTCPFWVKLFLCLSSPGIIEFKFIYSKPVQKLCKSIFSALWRKFTGGGGGADWYRLASIAWRSSEHWSSARCTSKEGQTRLFFSTFNNSAGHSGGPLHFLIFLSFSLCYLFRQAHKPCTRGTQNKHRQSGSRNYAEALAIVLNSSRILA